MKYRIAAVLLLALYIALEACMFSGMNCYLAGHLNDPDPWYPAWLAYHILDLEIRYSVVLTIFLALPAIYCLKKEA